MSLFKNRNKMEKRLKKQLSGLEYKPSDALWNKIQHGLPSEFELQLSKKVASYSTTPDPEIWNRLSTLVPQQESTYKRFGLLALLVAFVGLSVVAAIFYLNQPKETPVAFNTNSNQVGLNNSNLKIKRHTAPIPEVSNSIDIASLSTGTESNQKRASLHSKTLPADVDRIKAIISSKKTTMTATKKTNAQRSRLVSDEKVASISPNFKKEVSQSPILDSYKNVDQPNQSATEQQPNQSLSSIKNDALDSSTSAKETQLMAVKSSPPLLDDSTTKVILSTQATASLDEALPTRFMLIADVGMNYCFTILSAPSAGNRAFKSNLALRQSVEIPAIDWSGAFRISYDLNDRWRISGGISLLNFTQAFNYNTTTPVMVNAGSDHNARYINATDSIVNGSAYSTRIKYSWTEIPLTIAYKMTQKKTWNVEAEVGLSYALLSTADAGMINYDNVGVLVIKDREAFPGLINSWFFNFCPAITYKLNESIVLAAHPSLKLSLNNMIADDTWLKQYPVMTGLTLSLRKRL